MTTPGQMQRGQAARITWQFSGVQDTVTIRRAAHEHLCVQCAKTIHQGEDHGVHRRHAWHFCLDHCELIPAAARERELAERRAVNERHEAALAQQLSGSEVLSGYVWRQQERIGKWPWDFIIEAPIQPYGAMLLVDVQGGLRLRGGGKHGSPDGYANDMNKAVYAMTEGYCPIFVTGEMVQDGRALAVIERLITTPTTRTQNER